MALQQYRIPQFLGLNQGACENGIDALTGKGRC